MLIVFFVVLVVGLVLYTSRKQPIDYDTSSNKAEEKSAKQVAPILHPIPKKPTFQDDPYLKVFLFVQEVFVLYLTDQATDKEKQQIKKLIKDMETDEMKVVETFAIDKRMFQNESLVHAKTLLANKNKIYLHHTILESKETSEWKVIMSSLATNQVQDFSESFVPAPSFVHFQGVHTSTAKINPILLV